MRLGIYQLDWIFVVVFVLYFGLVGFSLGWLFFFFPCILLCGSFMSLKLKILKVVLLHFKSPKVIMSFVFFLELLYF